MKKLLFFAVLLFLAAAVLLPPQADGRTDAARTAFLRTCALDPCPTAAEVAEVHIPADFDAVYTAYNALQKEAGFDLTPYAGKTVVRYTYLLQNNEENGDWRANILVYDGEIIGGDVMTVAAEGVMRPLR